MPDLSQMNYLYLKAFGGRFLQAFFSLVGAALLIWAVLPLAPGDPARRILQAQGIVEPTRYEITEMRRFLDLDKPVVVRFGRWLANAFKGDLGLSWQTGKPVYIEFGNRLPATVRLALCAFLLSMIVAVPAGIIAAKYHNKWPDSILRGFALFGAASPSFIVSLFFIQFVIIGFGWGKVVLDGHWYQVWIPAAVLTVDIIAVWSRLLRAGLLEIISKPFIISARARGASQNRALLVHGLPNAAIPLLHAMGITLGSLLGGTIIVETIFTWPGLGRYVVEAITARDLPVVQAYALFATICYVTVSLFTDIASSLLDPRITKRWV